ncbi:hypothetical protein BP00DRAFT_232371 [Aspergillus indologenus CBS 114.80]|uniref:BTB domain-containing protein n=1 Tax=Aspergillus indologenus CBS 114.80 TaxID=1450541 RepID=A0A2V5J5R1_9EURO|nr:hypothetical protein BP00DRAFT_232371 [Aspergillus indologenus CBS 114.80]
MINKMPEKKVLSADTTEALVKERFRKASKLPPIGLKNKIENELKVLEQEFGPPKLTIKCGQRSYSVCLLRAALHSDFIKRRFGWNGSKKRSDMTLILDEDPAVVEEMIRYLTSDSVYMMQAPDDSTLEISKLNLQSSNGTSARKTSQLCEGPGQRVTSGRLKSFSFSALAFQIRVFTLAKRLEIDGLKKSCRGKIIQELSLDMDRTALLHAISEIYAFFGESDQGLRDMVVATARKNLHVFKKQRGQGYSVSALKDVLVSNTHFCRDFIIDMVRTTPQNCDNDADDNVNEAGGGDNEFDED